MGKRVRVRKKIQKRGKIGEFWEKMHEWGKKDGKDKNELNEIDRKDMMNG